MPVAQPPQQAEVSLYESCLHACAPQVGAEAAAKSTGRRRSGSIMRSDSINSLAATIGISAWDNLAQEQVKPRRRSHSLSALGGQENTFNGSPFREEDVAGKTTVVVKDDELWNAFKRDLKDSGVKTGVGVKMVLHRFVSENVSGEDVSKCMEEIGTARAWQKQSSGGMRGKALMRAVSEANLAEFGSNQPSPSPVTGRRRQSYSSYASDQAARESPSAADAGNIFDGLSFLGENIAKVGMAVRRRSSKSALGQEVEGFDDCSSVHTAPPNMMADNPNLAPISLGGRPPRRTKVSARRRARNDTQLDQSSGVPSMAQAAALVAAMDKDDLERTTDPEDVEMQPLPPRAMERKRRASGGSLGALSMAELAISEDSDEDVEGYDSSDSGGGGVDYGDESDGGSGSSGEDCKDMDGGGNPPSEEHPTHTMDKEEIGGRAPRRLSRGSRGAMSFGALSILTTDSEPSETDDHCPEDRSGFPSTMTTAGPESGGFILSFPSSRKGGQATAEAQST